MYFIYIYFIYNDNTIIKQFKIKIIMILTGEMKNQA